MLALNSLKILQPKMLALLRARFPRNQIRISKLLDLRFRQVQKISFTQTKDRWANLSAKVLWNILKFLLLLKDLLLNHNHQARNQTCITRWIQAVAKLIIITLAIEVSHKKVRAIIKTKIREKWTWCSKTCHSKYRWCSTLSILAKANRLKHL